MPINQSKPDLTLFEQIGTLFVFNFNEENLELCTIYTNQHATPVKKGKSHQGIDGGIVKMGGKSSLAEKLLIKTGL